MNTDTIGARGSIHVSASYSQSAITGATTTVRRAQPKQAKFQIDGISCASDAARLEHRLSRQMGVIGVSVNTINDFAYVAYDPTITSSTLLQRQIEFSGFSARER